MYENIYVNTSMALEISSLTNKITIVNTVLPYPGVTFTYIYKQSSEVYGKGK